MYFHGFGVLDEEVTVKAMAQGSAPPVIPGIQ
jgi:hypothetical protein